MATTYHFVIVKKYNPFVQHRKSPEYANIIKNATSENFSTIKQIFAVRFNIQFGDNLFKNCPVSNCKFTENSTMFKESDAIMFHA